MSKKHLYTLAILICCTMLSACKVSEENLSSITKARDELTQQKGFAEEIYGKLTTDAYGEDLLAYETQYNAITDFDTEKLKDKDVQELLPKINNLTESYKTLYSEMEKELEVEGNALAESAKHTEILCYIENKSGSEFNSIILKDTSLATETENYLKEGTTLPSGRILTGIILPINLDSNSRILSVTDTLGKVYDYALNIENISSAAENGISIILGSPENGAEISSYSSNN